MVQNFSSWLMNLAILAGVLVIAAFGVAWSIAGNEDTEYKRKLKEWATNIIIGLAILFFFSQILRFLAPWIFV